MAYGNWGAFVYKNGERQKSREDNTPYKEDELQAGYWQAFINPDQSIDVHHASLGDGEIRLCGYKCYPKLYWQGIGVNLEQFEKEWEDDDQYGLKIENFHGNKINIEKMDNWVRLSLIQPDGTSWESICGYERGAGHED